MRMFRIVGLVLLVAAGVVAALAAWKWTFRSGEDYWRTQLAALALPDEAGVTVQWFGTSCLLIRDGKSSILIDPFFTRPEGLLPLLMNSEIAPDPAVIDYWLQAAGVERLDAILVSHSHYDHILDAAVVARRTGAVLLGSASTIQFGRGSGLADAHLREISTGEPMRYGSFTISFVESRHAGSTGGRPTGDIEQQLGTPARYLDFKQGGTYSIVIEHARGTALIHASAGFKANALKSYSADTVLLGIAMVSDQEEYLSEVVDAVDARRILPVHWDDFTRSLDRPLRPLPIGLDIEGFTQHVAENRPAIAVEFLPVAKPALLFD